VNTTSGFLLERRDKMNHLSYESSPADDFRMRYSCFIDDIKYLKSRQWSVTYYLLLLFGAIVGFQKALPKTANLNNELFVLALGIGIIGIIGIAFQHDFQRRLQEYRRHNMKEVVPYMSKAFQEYENRVSQRRKRYTSFFNGIGFTMIFVLILWMGVSLVYCYLFGVDIEMMVAFAFVPPLLFLLYCIIWQARENEKEEKK